MYIIDYDDGDHEWINIDKEKDRVQIQVEDSSWVMYNLYRPAGLVEDWLKRDQIVEIINYKEDAWKDALQWKVITDDKTGKHIYLSTETSELRGASEDAELWQIVDDGNGFPTFYNIHTGDINHEDPRFDENTHANIIKQKDFLMHEIRYNLYFCKDYWDQYNIAIKLDDPKRIRTLIKSIYNSNKPKILAALLVKAKLLLNPVSIVDQPLDHDIKAELEYITW